MCRVSGRRLLNGDDDGSKLGSAAIEEAPPSRATSERFLSADNDRRYDLASLRRKDGDLGIVEDFVRTN